MKTRLAVSLLLALGVTAATAQYSSAKRMAREAENKINERHRSAEDGAPPPTPPTRPGLGAPSRGTPPGQPGLAPQTPPATQTPAPAAPPVKPASQQVAAAKLKADIADAHTKGEATAEMKQQFVADLAAAVTGRSRPSAASLEKLGTSLLTALAAKNVSLTGTDKLLKAVIVSLNSAGLSSARLQELNHEVQGLLAQAGVPAGDVTLAGQNLATVVSDIQSGAGK